VTAAVRVMGLTLDRRFTTDHGGRNRATWSARQGGRIRLGLRLVTCVP